MRQRKRRYGKCMLNVNLVVGWVAASKKMGDSATFSSQEAHIQLLDAALGHPVKDWQFSGREVISIGRMPESDVEISELRVSRLHAQLHWREGKWILVSCGRHGVIVNNRQITE